MSEYVKKSKDDPTIMVGDKPFLSQSSSRVQMLEFIRINKTKDVKAGIGKKDPEYVKPGQRKSEARLRKELEEAGYFIGAQVKFKPGPKSTKENLDVVERDEEINKILMELGHGLNIKNTKNIGGFKNAPVPILYSSPEEEYKASLRAPVVAPTGDGATDEIRAMLFGGRDKRYFSYPFNMWQWDMSPTELKELYVEEMTRRNLKELDDIRKEEFILDDYWVEGDDSALVAPSGLRSFGLYEGGQFDLRTFTENPRTWQVVPDDSDSEESIDYENLEEESGFEYMPFDKPYNRDQMYVEEMKNNPYEKSLKGVWIDWDTDKIYFQDVGLSHYLEKRKYEIGKWSEDGETILWHDEDYLLKLRAPPPKRKEETEEQKKESTRARREDWYERTKKKLEEQLTEYEDALKEVVRIDKSDEEHYADPTNREKSKTNPKGRGKSWQTRSDDQIQESKEKRIRQRLSYQSLIREKKALLNKLRREYLANTFEEGRRMYDGNWLLDEGPKGEVLPQPLPEDYEPDPPEWIKQEVPAPAPAPAPSAAAEKKPYVPYLERKAAAAAARAARLLAEEEEPSSEEEISEGVPPPSQRPKFGIQPKEVTLPPAAAEAVLSVDDFEFPENDGWGEPESVSVVDKISKAIQVDDSSSSDDDDEYDDGLVDDDLNLEETAFDGVSYWEDEDTGKLYRDRDGKMLVGKWTDDMEDIIFANQEAQEYQEFHRP
jgi:hypothetical protein